MVRLRHAVMAVALGTGAMGCALTQSPSHVAHYSIWHCDECDDFPTPAYGPGYSMMPGSYTRPPAQELARVKASQRPVLWILVPSRRLSKRLAPHRHRRPRHPRRLLPPLTWSRCRRTPAGRR